MAINTINYSYNEETVVVEVFINGKSVGICEESQVANLIEKISK